MYGSIFLPSEGQFDCGSVLLRLHCWTALKALLSVDRRSSLCVKFANMLCCRATRVSRFLSFVFFSYTIVAIAIQCCEC